MTPTSIAIRRRARPKGLDQNQQLPFLRLCRELAPPSPPGGVQPVIMNGEFHWNLSDLLPSNRSEYGNANAAGIWSIFRVRAASKTMKLEWLQIPLLRPTLSQETLEAVVAELRDSHPFASLYKTAGDMHKEWKQNHPGQVLPAFEVVLLTNREAEGAGIVHPNLHPHRTGGADAGWKEP